MKEMRSGERRKEGKKEELESVYVCIYYLYVCMYELASNYTFNRGRGICSYAIILTYSISVCFVVF